MRIWTPLPTISAEVSDLWDWIHETRFVFLQTLAQNGWWQPKGVSNSASLYVLYTQTWAKKQLYMALTKHRWITFQILIKKNLLQNVKVHKNLISDVIWNEIVIQIDRNSWRFCLKLNLISIPDPSKNIKEFWSGLHLAK